MLKISDEVRRVFALVVQYLGESFSLQELTLFTGGCRGKTLLVEQMTIPVSLSGYCLALQDVDLVVTREGMDTILTQVATLHEIAHLLLRHIPLCSDGSETPTYATFQGHYERYQHVVYRDNGSRYDDPHEQDAETLATLLLGCISHTGDTFSEVARDIYGW